MVTLPPEFIETKYPGYFWNSNDNQLYSVKITGMLKPLVKAGPGKYKKYLTANEPGYYVSHKGRRRFLPISYLSSLVNKDTIFPVYHQMNLPI